MRKKIPCRIVGSVPLSVYNDLLQQAPILTCVQYLPDLKYIEQAGALIYSSNLIISNICENEAPAASSLDMYF
jgi:hypothetical protein